MRKDEFIIEELVNVEIKGDVEIEILAPVRKLVEKLEEIRLERAEFIPVKKEWANQIEEVRIGATKSDGGSREKVIVIGGDRALPFYFFDHERKNPLALALDVFDIPIKLPRVTREMFRDSMNDPVDWARKNVEFGADLVALHLISTDPIIQDRSPSEAAKVVEDVLQNVKVPLIIGGSGNADKDPELFDKVCDVCSGERCLIASANLNMDYRRIADAVKRNGHAVVSFTPMDINQQKMLNRYLLNAGVERKSIVMDPTTAALGLGLDYSFSNIERMRIEALKGDKDLSFPILCASSNAWAAREAWMKESPNEEDTDWGPREVRGIMWEVVTALTLALAGADLFMMSNPASLKLFREVISSFGKEKSDVDPLGWVTR